MSAKTRSAEDSWVRDLRWSAMARGRPMAYARRNGGWPGVAARAWTLLEGAQALKTSAQGSHDALAGSLRLQTTAQLLTQSHGLKVLVQGKLPNRPTVMVAQATGYVEAAACLSVSPSLPFVHQDVESWAAIGPALQAAGSIFVGPDTDRLRPMLAARRRLQVGASLLILSSKHMSRWVIALFELAQRAGISITPVRATVSRRRLRWGDHQSFRDHYLGAARLRRASVHLTYLPSFIPTFERPPREWMFVVQDMLSNRVAS